MPKIEGCERCFQPSFEAHFLIERQLVLEEKYALLRRKYLKQHRRVTYTNLLTEGKLNTHLMEIEQTAILRLEELVAQMAKTEGLTEQMKAEDPLRWTGLMNNIRQAAEEMILTELIYS